MIHISKSEWKFLTITFLIVVFFAFLPTIIGYFAAPQGSVFSFRSSIGWDDYPVYFSYINQVKAGHFFFEDLFTGESQSILVFNPFWLGVGIFARIFSLSAQVAFHLARLFLTPLLFIAAYCLIATFFEGESKRKACFALLLIASGIVQLYTSEVFLFSSIYQDPHLIAALILIILVFLFSLLAFENYKLRYSVWAGLFSLLLFSFHPYHIPTIFGVLSVFIIVDVIKNRKINLDYFQHCGIVVLFSLFPIFYYVWQLQYNVIFFQWSLQNITLTPPLLVVLSNYGLLLPLSAAGIFYLSKKKNLDQRHVFLLVWFFVQSLLIYLPIKSQINLVNGLELPMIMLATYGIFYLVDAPKLKRYFLEHGRLHAVISIPLPAIILVLFFSFFHIFVFLADVRSYLTHDPNMYIDNRNVFATAWLKGNTPPSSVIFSSLSDGSLIASMSLRKVFIGHRHETIHFAQKSQEAEHFAKQQDGSKRLAFLKENHINYLFVGPEEKKALLFNPAEDAFLEKVYDNGYVVIYKVP